MVNTPLNNAFPFLATLGHAFDRITVRRNIRCIPGVWSGLHEQAPGLAAA
ncbi:hypothetical protein [Neorhizobium alkalisoli]|nr:hypothetical protein [Neorhizobium alkalisoli]